MTIKHSPSCDRNSQPIFDVLKEYIAKDTRLLEIGSGTGQHAVYFADKFDSLHWVTSDVKENHKDIESTVRQVKLEMFMDQRF